MIKINLSVLLSALIIAPKKDVRYYLNGVFVSVDRVVATDGHRMFGYDLSATYQEGGDNFDNDQPIEPIIIPRESIEQLNKSLTAKERRDAVITIIKINDHYVLCHGSIEIMFKPIDGKYPDYKRVIPKDYTPKYHSSYNWAYMADFQKISKLLGNKFGVARLLPNGNDSALVILPDAAATCVIMPMRD